MITLLAAWAAADAAEATSPVRIDADLAVLCGLAEPGPGQAPILSRNIHHPDHSRALDWLEAQLRTISGLQTEREPVLLDGQPEMTNLVATLPCAACETGSPAVVLSAHWDSIASLDPDPWDPSVDAAPGCDDDASGVALVLEVARVMATWTPRFNRPIRFVLFDGEEEGLLGSRAHAATLAEAGDPPWSVISADPIGYNAGGASMVWATWDARSEVLGARFADHAAEVGSPLDLRLVDAELIAGDHRSDHYAFWEQGMEALHLASFPQPVTYHTRDDLRDRVDLAYTSELTRLLAGWVTAEAEPLAEVETPGAACGCGTAGRRVGSPAALLLVLGSRVRRPRGARDLQ